MLEVQRLEARTLDRAHPGGALQIAARSAEPLPGQDERHALDVELEAAIRRPRAEQLGEALHLPQPPKYEGRSPRPSGLGLQSLGPHPLHDAQALAEPRERLEQLVEGAIGDELVAPAERGDHALADAAALTAGLDDLEILGP